MNNNKYQELLDKKAAYEEEIVKQKADVETLYDLARWSIHDNNRKRTLKLAKKEALKLALLYFKAAANDAKIERHNKKMLKLQNKVEEENFD